MKKSSYAVFLTVLTFIVGLAQNSTCARDLNAALAKGFVHPPPDARPWVYWFWLNGNIISNGVPSQPSAPSIP
jgi:hypothetical protein